ncbi:MAG: hypothetical protein JO319_12210 [Acidobacteriaceae bacterium]|nr:hypothetical protein [Acidobacteriaceae bacterium]
MTSEFNASPELLTDLRRVMRPALGLGILLAIVSMIGGILDPGDFFRSYLMSYLFWLGLALGSLAVVMMQYLTSGAWGVLTRRTFESATRTLPFLALLFIPIACATPVLYDWAHADLVHKEYALAHRAGYMNTTMFILRAIAYFAIWLVFTYLLNKWSADQDEDGADKNRIEKRLAAISAPGLILYVFTVTFSSVDWAESLETDWYSTMWGFLFVARQGLTAFAFVIIVLTLLARREPLLSKLKTSHIHDLGKLLLTFVMVWAYFAFSQLVIVWSGNLTDEIPWYLRRFATSWGVLGVLLIIFEFIVPFLLLLSRPLKRNAYALCGVVGIIIVMRWIDLAWIVFPEYYHEGFRVTWLDFAVPLAMSSLWVAVFVWELRKRPLLPLQPPNLTRALLHEGQ